MLAVHLNFRKPYVITSSSPNQDLAEGHHWFLLGQPWCNATHFFMCDSSLPTVLNKCLTYPFLPYAKLRSKTWPHARESEAINKMLISKTHMPSCDNHIFGALAMHFSNGIHEPAIQDGPEKLIVKRRYFRKRVPEWPLHSSSVWRYITRPTGKRGLFSTWEYALESG